MESNFDFVNVRYFCHVWKSNFVKCYPEGQTIYCDQCKSDYLEVDEPTIYDFAEIEEPINVQRILVLPDNLDETQTECAEDEETFEYMPRRRYFSQQRSNTHQRLSLPPVESGRSNVQIRQINTSRSAADRRNFIRSNSMLRRTPNIVFNSFPRIVSKIPRNEEVINCKCE